MKIKSIIHNAALLALALMIAGCEEEEQYQLRFSHYLHVTENGMGCDDCHGEPGQPAFNAITHDTCLDCHEEPEAEEISVDTCGICHQEKQIALYETAAMRTEDKAPETEHSVTAGEELMEGAEEEPTMVAEQLTMVKEEEPAESAQEKPEEEGAEEQVVTSGKSVFIHTEALAEKCMDCHDYLMVEELATVPVLERDDIIAMRNKAHMSGLECATCHVDMAPSIAPASHDVAWMKRHGQFGMQDDASCSVCHTEDSCTECHSVMQPANHNNLWRMRSHGAVAAWNRASCQVCHEEDSCSSCHAENPPRSHNARWEENHCYGCHTATPAGEGCVVCHEEGNNVLLHQSFWPPVHDFFGNQANCYDCHNPYE